MENFLDTNIIFHYSNYTDNSSIIVERSHYFIKEKSGNFILCFAGLRELDEIVQRRRRLHKAILEKIKDPNFSFEESPLISFRDIRNAKKLYEKFKNRYTKDVKKILDKQRTTSEIKIKKFLQYQLDEKVIPIEKINIQLVSKIHDIISNHADCKILASALQLQKERKLFLFVTADKDFNENGYSYLREHFEINHSNEKWKFPELKNLLSNG